jgi:beta-glucosidase/6-phospho-beta-glucosidase/beta-galactosidase
MKFGLYTCDWETKERKPKASAKIYAKLAHLRMLEAVDEEISDPVAEGAVS